MDIIGKRKIFLAISGALVALSWVFILAYGFRQGIDLKGGTDWQIRFEKSGIDEDTLRGILVEEAQLPNVSVRTIEDNTFLLRLPSIGENEHQAYFKLLKDKFGEAEEKRFDSIGPAVGASLKNRAITAFVLVMLGISSYVAWAFRKVSKPVASWKYGAITLITLFHDVSIPAGLFALLGRWKGAEIDTNFIVALLVIMGFSVHDTIVVFDRIRENLLTNRDTQRTMAQIVNQSVLQTFARSVNTSLTLILILTALYFFGPGSLNHFVLTILAGTIVGTYSSIFVASPLIVITLRRK
jgi:preprotein translocase subunit SecF